MRHGAKDFASEVSLVLISGNELYPLFRDFDGNLILQEQKEHVKEAINRRVYKMTPVCSKMSIEVIYAYI